MKDGRHHELKEEVVVVDTDAVHDHATVVVVLDGARVADGAVVHPRQLVHLARLAVLELPVVSHLEVDEGVGLEVVVVYQRVEGILQERLAPWWLVQAF